MTNKAVYPPYSMTIEWDPRDGIFVVTIPEFERCHTHGHSYEDAARNGRFAIESAVDLDRELGRPLPNPLYFDDHSELWEMTTAVAREIAAFDSRAYPPYSIILRWDPRSDIFIATIPEFQGARTHGKSYEDATRMGQEVIEMFVDLWREDGRPLPVWRAFHARQFERVA